MPLPWPLKRFCLQCFYDYRLDPTARIGFAWVYPRHLAMSPGSRIDALNVAVNLDRLELAECAMIGRGNWITGHFLDDNSPHFDHQHDRFPGLYLGEHAAITKNHLIDCTNRVSIGPYAIIAGYSTQILSHSLDLYHNRQHSEPISIGAYCFVGSNCLILGGGVLPDYSVLGALSLLNKSHVQPWGLYAGQPATWLKPIDQNAAFFRRRNGFVV